MAKSKLKNFTVNMTSPSGEGIRVISLGAVDEDHAREIANEQAIAIARADAGSHADDPAAVYDYVQENAYVVDTVEAND